MALKWLQHADITQAPDIQRVGDPSALSQQQMFKKICMRKAVKAVHVINTLDVLVVRDTTSMMRCTVLMSKEAKKTKLCTDQMNESGACQPLLCVISRLCRYTKIHGVLLPLEMSAHCRNRQPKHGTSLRCSKTPLLYVPGMAGAASCKRMSKGLASERCC